MRIWRKHVMCREEENTTQTKKGSPQKSTRLGSELAYKYIFPFIYLSINYLPRKTQKEFIMELVMSIGPLTTSLACILIVAWIWNAVDWVWLRPKKLEKKLREQGFKGNSYKLFYGDKKQINQLIKEATSKPMDQFSNDYGPRVLPFLHQTISNYGEKSLIWEGPKPAINITQPELIREVLMNVTGFTKQGVNPVIKKLTNGLGRLEGKKWARERKLINPAFHINKLKHMLPAFYTSAQEMINEWEKQVPERGSLEVEMWSFLQNMSADAISRAAFGSSFEEGRRIFELIREQLVIIIRTARSVYIPGSRFLPTPTNRKMDKINDEIKALLKGMIYRRKKAMEVGEAPKDDLLGMLLRSSFIQDDKHHVNGVDNKKQENIKLSLEQVVEECNLFYLAGQDTTSSLLVWTLVLLSIHKDWQHQAREEVIDTFGNNAPDYDGLNQLKKINMIFQEVLRLYAPAAQLTREASHDITLGNMQLPAGVLIHLPMVYVHHNEKIWGLDAKEFNPERFSAGILKATGGNMSFFSFGWGPRICIGSNFAMMEAKVTLALILQRFSLELSPSYAHAPTMGNGTLRPQFGAQMILRRLN